MEFTNEFTIPLPVDEAMDVLTDLERVAPCMPGAVLESVEGNTYSGRVKVKVGPMSLTYSGTATVTERDDEAGTARIEASGREKRGSGTATADVSAVLIDKGSETGVTVTTDIAITGKPAQFGRGVMADVGEKIIERFSENLREQLQEQPPSATEETPGPGAATDSPSSGPRLVEQVAPRDEALDLVEVAGDATIKRVLPLVAAAIIVVLLLRRRRRR